MYLHMHADADTLWIGRYSVKSKAPAVINFLMEFIESTHSITTLSSRFAANV